MKNRTTMVFLLILTLSIYVSNNNVQSAVEENNYQPTLLELVLHDPISITSDGNFTDYDFLGTGTEEDPYVIEGYNITATDGICINIVETTKYFIVRNCYVDAEEYGIYIYNVADGTATVINNTCNNNGEGISITHSDYSTVANNTCSNNDWDGISLTRSDYSTVANNTCSNNYFSIALHISGNSTVANNTCNNNNNTGIYLWFSDFCVVTYNLLQENEKYGVYLVSSSDNTIIHHNNFVDNNPLGDSQAYDECTDNTWYDTETLEGNFWSDWSGIGTYAIDGSVGAVDLYPLGEPLIVEYPQMLLLTLLLSIFALFLTRIIAKKIKKDKNRE